VETKAKKADKKEKKRAKKRASQGDLELGEVQKNPVTV
jgi:hypothetical protein